MRSRTDGGRAHFSWNASRGAARYGLEVGRDAGMADRVLARETDQTALAEALPPGKYFWRTRALEADGQAGPWSAASPVILPPPAPAGLVARLEGDQLIAEWKGEAAAYRLEVARDARFGQIVSRHPAREARLAIARPEPGDYWLRVTALGAEGVESLPGPALPVAVQPDRPWWLLLCVVPLL